VKAGDLVDRRHEVDVVLVHLDVFYDLLYSFYNAGLLYIASYLRQNGWRVQCLKTTDIFKLTRPQLRYLFQTCRPRIVGFYTLADNVYGVRDLAKDVKAWLPNAAVVVGGPQASVADTELMACPSFDFAIRGEGEEPMLALINHLRHGLGALHDIPGVTYRSDGQVVRGAPPRIVHDLDALPLPEHHLVGVGDHVQIVTSRGCPYSCTFCFRDAAGKVARFRSPESVMREVRRDLEEYGVHALEFVDDTFTIPPKRVTAICEQLIEYRKATGRQFIFYCEGRVDVLDGHPHILPLLKGAGLARLQIGIESGDAQTLKIYRKKLQEGAVERVLRRCAESPAISVIGNFILGAPFEKDATFQRSLEFARHLLRAAPAVFECTSCFLCPYPSTEMQMHPEQFGLKIYDDQFKRGLSLSDVHMESEDLDAAAIRQLQVEFDAAVDQELWRLGETLPPEVVFRHFDWAHAHRMPTMWFMRALSKVQILAEYDFLRRSPRYARLADIPRADFLHWVPQRPIEKRTYTRSGRLLLPGWFRKLYLTHPEEKSIYELSAGKLRMRDVAEEIRRLHRPAATLDEVVRNVLIPTFEKLERTFHIAFYR